MNPGLRKKDTYWNLWYHRLIHQNNRNCCYCCYLNSARPQPHSSMPDLILINSGTYNNCRAWNNRITILLIYLPLNTVSTCTENGDKRIIRRITSGISSHAVIQSISIIASQLTGINFLDAPSISLRTSVLVVAACSLSISACLLTWSYSFFFRFILFVSISMV